MAQGVARRLAPDEPDDTCLGYAYRVRGCVRLDKGDVGCVSDLSSASEFLNDEHPQAPHYCDEMLKVAYSAIEDLCAEAGDESGAREMRGRVIEIESRRREKERGTA